MKFSSSEILPYLKFSFQSALIDVYPIKFTVRTINENLKSSHRILSQTHCLLNFSPSLNFPNQPPPPEATAASDPLVPPRAHSGERCPHRCGRREAFFSMPRRQRPRTSRQAPYFGVPWRTLDPRIGGPGGVRVYPKGKLLITKWTLYLGNLIS